MSDSGASQHASLSAGFALLIGTQLVILVCGWLLWLRERSSAQPRSAQALHSTEAET